MSFPPPIYAYLKRHFMKLVKMQKFVALAITLNVLVLNLENDIIEVLIVTYRLKEWKLESGNKVAIAHFETSKFR